VLNYKDGKEENHKEAINETNQLFIESDDNGKA